MYCYVNNLDEWAMRQKLAVDGFKCKGKKSRSTQILKQNSNEGNNKGYILEAVNYPKHQQKIHIYLYFLPEIVKIDKYQKVVCNIYIYIYTYIILQEIALNYGLILEKMQSVIRFNQEARFNSYIDITTVYREKRSE